MTPRAAILAGLDRPCIRCAHHEHEPPTAEYARCMTPAVTTSFVSGEAGGYGVPASAARGRDGRCGWSGTFWEAKE